ncbi:TetR/AcrR family transcriptional regulator [Novosphingobium resinovorum]|uniref:TetR/AcrR family transcriptional regulator n=1 Tax=Novosphingobium resinovorum TaxID=158500 RepID=UPI002ED54F64|nr:TetR/AcrR family transcriptional regulator [Novosphingobium resinovorum]
MQKNSEAPFLLDEERLENIRRVVLELVASRGLEGVTVDAIAAAARVSKQTLYKTWRTKSALIRDVVRMISHGAHLGDPGDLGSLREELWLILESATGILQTNRRLIVALLDGAQRDPDIMSIMRRDTRDKYRESLQRPLKRAIARGDISPETDLNLIADVALPVLLHRAILDDVLDEEMVKTLLDDVLMNLVIRPGRSKD